jgi:PKD repeat protein
MPLFTTTSHLTVIATGAGHVTSSPPGIDCPPTCEADYPTDMGTLPNSTDTVVTLTATPRAGSVFVHWDDLEGFENPPGPCAVPVASPNTCEIHLGDPSAGVMAVFSSDPLPTASFTATPIPGAAEPAFTFDGSGSSDTDGQITNYHWDFGDGDSANTTTPTSQHFYSCSGPTTVTLTVTDETGRVGAASDQLKLPGSLASCT